MVSFMRRRSKRWARKRIRRWLKRQRKRRRNLVRPFDRPQPVRDRVRWLPVAPTRLGLSWRGHDFAYVAEDRRRGSRA
jgi:hypothetical protein